MFESTFIRIITASIVFLLFSYCEHRFECGLIVSALLNFVIVMENGNWISSLLFAAQFSLSESGLRHYSYLMFLALEFIFIFFHKQEDVTKVQNWRPYEERIRSFLLKAEPSVLHLVDDMLDKYSNREEELYIHLQHLHMSDNKSNGSYIDWKLSEVRGIMIKKFFYAEPHIFEEDVNTENELITEKVTPDIEVHHTHVDNQPTVTASTLRRVRSPESRRVMGKKWGNGSNSDQSGTNTFPFQNIEKDRIIRRIHEILKEHSPLMYQFVDRMLQDYYGREDELLRALGSEFGISIPISDCDPDPHSLGDQNKRWINSDIRAGPRQAVDLNDNFNYRTDPNDERSNFSYRDNNVIEDMSSDTDNGGYDEYDRNDYNNSNYMHNGYFESSIQNNICVNAYYDSLKSDQSDNRHPRRRNNFPIESLDIPDSRHWCVSSMSGS